MDQPHRAWLDAVLRAFYRSALFPLLQRINAYLVRWIRKKYKRFRPFKKPRRAGSASPATTPALRPLGMDADVLVIRMTRAV